MISCILYKYLRLLVGITACVVFTTVIFLPIFDSIILSIPPSKSNYDYLMHIKSVPLLFDYKLPAPHFLFHLCTAMIYKFFNFNEITFEYAALITVLLCEILTSIILFLFFCQYTDEFSSLICAMGLNTFSPIYFLYPMDYCLYLGYLNPNAVHNPTLIMLKPFALLAFIMSKEIFFDTNKISMILFSFFLILSGLAKPSFIIVVLPSLLILYIINRHKMNKGHIVITICLCFFMLIYMFIFNYIGALSYVIIVLFFLPIIYLIHRHNMNKLYILMVSYLYCCIVFISFKFNYITTLYFLIIILSFLPIIYLIHRHNMNKQYILIVSYLYFLTLICISIFNILHNNSIHDMSRVGFTINKPFLATFNLMESLNFPVNYSYIFFKLLFSMSFPIYIFFVYFNYVKNDFYFQYALILMFFSLLISAFIAEFGPIMHHVNFGWSALICNFMLFISSLRIFVCNHQLSYSSHLLGLYLFGIHILCGIIYYISIFAGRKYF